MKNVQILIFVLLSVAIAGCQKDETGKPVATQEVSFGIEMVNSDGIKSDLPVCQEDESGNRLMPNVLEIEIINQQIGLVSTISPQIFVLNDKLYSQAIKLAPGQYTITKSLMLTENGGTVVMAAPGENSEFGQYVVNGVNFEFEVTTFAKTEADMEVLCLSSEHVNEFGFFGFQVSDVVVRKQCFFGDLCIKNHTDYEGSYYDDLFTPLSNYPHDLPAIFKIEVTRNAGDWSKTFSNIIVENGIATQFVSPLCIKYPDRLVKNEVFTFDLYNYVRVGSSFQYKYFHTCTTEDGELLASGGDGVVDFVLGNGNYEETDLLLPPYQNHPNTASITISHPGNRAYWNLHVNNMQPAGVYDLPTGPMIGWCCAQGTSITPGTKSMYIYGSLYSTNWPAGMPFTTHDIAKVNWLLNNLGSFSGFYYLNGNTITSNDFTPEQGLVIQNAILGIIHGTNEVSGMAFDMAFAASDKSKFHSPARRLGSNPLCCIQQTGAESINFYRC